MKKRKLYKAPEIKTKKIKASYFYSLDRMTDSLLGYCITGGSATCYPPSCASSVPGCCTCFLEGTRVLMGDRTQKAIQDIKAGETVVAYNTDKKSFSMRKVSKLLVHQNTDGGYLVINDVLRVTAEHPIWINEGWKKAEELVIGDHLLNDMEQEVNVIGIQKIEGINTVYNLEVEEEHNYFAEGFLVHNKLFS